MAPLPLQFLHRNEAAPAAERAYLGDLSAISGDVVRLTRLYVIKYSLGARGELPLGDGLHGTSVSRRNALRYTMAGWGPGSPRGEAAEAHEALVRILLEG